MREEVYHCLLTGGRFGFMPNLPSTLYVAQERRLSLDEDVGGPSLIKSKVAFSCFPLPTWRGQPFAH
jgi:hypothetical protein